MGFKFLENKGVSNMSEKLIVDVRSREEFVKEHVKGAINIHLHDLEFYLDFLKRKEILLYCNTENRAGLAKSYLQKKDIKSEIISLEQLPQYEKEGKNIICAVNYVHVKAGYEEQFEKSVKELCKATDKIDGFLGSKLIKISGISANGTGIPGELSNMEIKPVKYIIHTYWESKEKHEKSHTLPVMVEAFNKMPVMLTQNPYEEYYEILK